MKKLGLVLSVLFLSIVIYAQTNPEWVWAQRAGSSAQDFGNDIAVDTVGNTYITGSFNGTATFGSIELTSYGGLDIFIAKLSPTGNFLWAIQAGGTIADEGNAISVDNYGFIYVAGYFSDIATFGALSLTATDPDWSDVFVATLDSDGNWLWATRAGGTSVDNAYSLAISNNGSIYLTGQFGYPSATFGSTTLNSSGGGDIFIAKLDSGGNWLWAKKAGGTDTDISYKISIDSYENLYVTGRFIYLATFGSFSVLCNTGSNDIFVAKADANGNWLWVRRAGGPEPDVGYGIDCDTYGNIYITGTFRVTADFGPFLLTMNGNNDLYVAKLDNNGNWLWASQAGGLGLDYGYAIVSDHRGTNVVTGYYNEPATFGSIPLTGYGLNDIFIAGIDTNGNWLWASKAGGSVNDNGRSIAMGENSDCYIIGSANSIVCNFGTLIPANFGSGDAIIAKLSYPALPPLSMPFYEDWSTASLGTNFWLVNSHNWHIDNTMGNPAPAVVFTGETGLENYDLSLTSHEFDGTNIDSAILRFHLELDYAGVTDDNTLSCEIWNGLYWHTLITFHYYDLYVPQDYYIDVSSYAVGNIFKIRFRAQGYISSQVNHWLIDNIRLKEVATNLPAPQNLTFTILGEDAVLSWDAVPEADWYGAYTSENAYNGFIYGGAIDASNTSVSIPIAMLWQNKWFVKLTAGAGIPPGTRNNTKQIFKNVK